MECSHCPTPTQTSIKKWVYKNCVEVFILPERDTDTDTDTDTDSDTDAIGLQTHFVGVAVGVGIDVGVGQCEHTITGVVFGSLPEGRL